MQPCHLATEGILCESLLTCNINLLTGPFQLLIRLLWVDGMPSVVYNEQEIWHTPAVHPPSPKQKQNVETLTNETMN